MCNKMLSLFSFLHNVQDRYGRNVLKRISNLTLIGCWGITDSCSLAPPQEYVILGAVEKRLLIAVHCKELKCVQT